MPNVYVSDTSAGRAISAYIVLNRKGETVATIRAFHGQSVLVNVFDKKAGFQYGRASGYGYDKFASALSGLTIDGHVMTNHCADNRKPPRGRKTWPRDAKAPRGYHFANFAEYWPDGNRVDRHLARFDDDYRARYDAAVAAGEIESGYTDCYRDTGLKYLEAIGYRVIQAI